MKCNCWSVGLDGDYATTKKDKPIIFDLKDYFPLEKPEHKSIDYCISPVLENLWKNGVETESSCCGHNGVYSDNPSIVLSHPPAKELAEVIRELIAEVDDRHFDLHAWKLCDF